MTPDAAAFVARVLRGRTALLLALSIGFVALSAWIATTGGTLAIVIGAIGMTFFGVCAMMIARQLVRGGPVLWIDHDGILWRRWSDARIPWAAVAAMRSDPVMSQSMLSLWFHAPDQHRSRRLLGKLARTNRWFGYGDLAISMSGLDQDYDALVDAVERFAPVTIERR